MLEKYDVILYNFKTLGELKWLCSTSLCRRVKNARHDGANVWERKLLCYQGQCSSALVGYTAQLSSQTGNVKSPPVLHYKNPVWMLYLWTITLQTLCVTCSLACKFSLNILLLWISLTLFLCLLYNFSNIELFLYVSFKSYICVITTLLHLYIFHHAIYV